MFVLLSLWVCICVCVCLYARLLSVTSADMYIKIMIGVLLLFWFCLYVQPMYVHTKCASCLFNVKTKQTEHCTQNILALVQISSITCHQLYIMINTQVPF